MKARWVTDYSQSGEQKPILTWARRRHGCFLDIGAGNGETFSNTHALFLAGWDGCCVEPSPSEFAHLCELYPQVMQTRNLERVNAAVTPDVEGLVNFYYVPGDHLSSLDGNMAGRFDVVPERIVVSAVRLHDLLDRLLDQPPFQDGFSFVSIDTEGSSLELLAAYREHPAWTFVECVCVEVENGLQRAQLAMTMPNWRTLAVTPNNVVLAR